ncbi:MAG TPA: hypothetical protein VGP06_19245 [Janthinobacterium sp.]|jgi:hypothetical protein|nr:hypothetical protein [Janthinobacterium sp.]
MPRERPITKAPDRAPLVAGLLFLVTGLSPALADLPFFCESLWTYLLTIWEQTWN